MDIDIVDRLEGVIDLIFEKVGIFYRSKWDGKGKDFILVWFMLYIIVLFFLCFDLYVSFCIDLL